MCNIIYCIVCIVMKVEIFIYWMKNGNPEFALEEKYGLVGFEGCKVA